MIADALDARFHAAAGVATDSKGRRVWPPNPQRRPDCATPPRLDRTEFSGWQQAPMYWAVNSNSAHYVPSFEGVGHDDCAPAGSDARLRRPI